MINKTLLKQQCQIQKLWVGIGCQKGVFCQFIESVIEQVFQENELDKNAIAGIATIDTKASEAGLVEFCHLHNFPLKTFTAEMLAVVAVPNPAKMIANAVGSPSVAEAAAILAASGVTISFLTENEKFGVNLLVPKQIFRPQGKSGAVTIAVASPSRTSL